MKRTLIIIIFCLIPFLTYTQEKKETGTRDTGKPETQSPEQKTTAIVKKPADQIPVQSQYSNDFSIKNINFNRVIDKGGKGELLEVEFEISNNTDYPLDLYIFVIASYIKREKTLSSFERPVPEELRIRSFVPYPDDINNFKYPINDKDGTIKKDRHGRECYNYCEYPHEPKAGVDSTTGKPYHIKEKLFVRTYHLSEYRVNYFFFNRAIILAFDKDGKPVYRQLYELNGWRR